jgi:hypothetical protein
MGSHDPFGYLKHKLWPKERSGIKLPIWLPTTKSRESPCFTCVQVACHICLEKISMMVITLFQTSSQSKVCTRRYGPPTSQESQFQEFWDFQLGSPKKKWHLGVDPMAKHKKYYNGEGGGFPQVWAVVNLMNLCLLVICPCTKSVLIMW